MKISLFKRYFQSLVLAVSLFACQKAIYPVTDLKPETDIKVSAALPGDAQAENTIVPYRQQVESRMNEVIGRATVELEGRSKSPETTLGNFVSDLQRTQATALYGKPVDIGLIVSGGLRAVIPKGNITVGHIFEVMPFENELLILTLSGATMQKLFQYTADRKNVSLSNVTLDIKNGKPTNILIGGEPFNPDQTYTVAVSDYLANGGDDMFFLKEAVKTEKAGILLRDAIIKQIRLLNQQHKPVETKIEGRVKLL